jgi:hypothetical protein
MTGPESSSIPSTPQFTGSPDFVTLGDLDAGAISVQVYADAPAGKAAHVEALHRGEAIPGAANGFV